LRDPRALAKVVVGVGQHVRNVYRFSRHQHPAGDAFSPTPGRMLLYVFEKFRVTSRLRPNPQNVTVKRLDVGAGGAAERPGGIG
jgi:hypothetical protein